MLAIVTCIVTRARSPSCIQPFMWGLIKFNRQYRCASKLERWSRDVMNIIPQKRFSVRIPSILWRYGMEYGIRSTRCFKFSTD